MKLKLRKEILALESDVEEIVKEDIEKAIEQLELKKKDMELCVGLIREGNQFLPKHSTPLMKAIDVAISALREKLYKLQEMRGLEG